MRCAVYSCNSDNKSKKSPLNNIKFHRFPKNAEMCKKWANATGRPNKFNEKTAYICSKHFLQSDHKINLQHQLLNYVPKSYRSLKDDAVPTQHLSFSSTTSNSKIRQRAQKRKHNSLKNNVNVVTKEPANSLIEEMQQTIEEQKETIRTQDEIIKRQREEIAKLKLKLSFVQRVHSKKQLLQLRDKYIKRPVPKIEDQ